MEKIVEKKFFDRNSKIAIENFLVNAGFNPKRKIEYLSGPTKHLYRLYQAEPKKAVKKK